MNTKVLLMSSSLLIAMNCINVGQAMEYNSELAQTNNSLQENSRNFIEIINYGRYQFNMKEFEIFLNTICKQLRNECKAFINIDSSEKSYKYYFDILIDTCIKFDETTVIYKVGQAIKDSIKVSEYSLLNDITSIPKLLQSILKDKFKIEELMEKECLKQENTLSNMNKELSDRQKELERQKKEFQYFRDVSRGDIYTKGNI